MVTLYTLRKTLLPFWIARKKCLLYLSVGVKFTGDYIIMPLELWSWNFRENVRYLNTWTGLWIISNTCRRRLKNWVKRGMSLKVWLIPALGTLQGTSLQCVLAGEEWRLCSVVVEKRKGCLCQEHLKHCLKKDLVLLAASPPK